MGDYTRLSSQPATADLVRGDLREIWSTNAPEAESPRRAGSVSGVSDMLDLESIATPRPRRLKAARKDPLPGLLADILGSDTSSDEFAPDAQSPCNVDQAPSPARRQPDITKQPRASNKRIRPKPRPKATESPLESPSSPHQALPAGRAGASSNARKRPTRPSTQAKNRTQTAAPASSRTKRKAQKHDEDMYELSDATDTETEAPPKKRRAKQPSSKEPRPPPARKSQAAKEEVIRPDSGITQARRKPTRVPKKTAGRGSIPRQKKAEPKSTSPATSESSGREDESDAGQVQDQDHITPTIARQTSNKLPPVSRPALSIGDGVAEKGVAPAAALKPSPAASRDAELVLPVVRKAEISPTPSTLLPPASMDTEPILSVAHQETSSTSPSAEPVLPVAHPGDPKLSPLASREPEPVPALAHWEVASPTPPKPLPTASREAEPALPLAPKAQEVIILSSESDDDHFPPAGSTSPLFVERQEPFVASGSPEATVMAKPALSPDHGWEPRLPTRNTRINPPASFRSHTLPKRTEKPELHRIAPALPGGIRDAFLSDEQPAATPPFPSPEAEARPNEEGVSPGEAWEEVVDDDALPAVLHKIVTRLHRSMKSREDIVRDIAAEYQENALRLLDNLRARHDEEKTSTLAALRTTSRAAASVFSGAGQEMADLINNLQEMDAAHAADALTRPILALKLESVAQLCQARLESYADGKRGSDLATEPEDSLDGLAQTYQAKLFDALGKLDNAVDHPNEVDSQVDEFITRCLSGETIEVQRVEVKKPVKPAKNADDALLEVLLDGIMNTFQETAGTSAQSNLGNAAVDADEDLEMADMDLLGHDSGLHTLFSRGKGLMMAQGGGRRGWRI